MRVAAIVTALALALIGGGCSGNGGSTKAFCDALRSGENPLDVFDRYDPTNVATARDQLQRGLDRLRELEQAAPGDIRDDMKALVDVGSKLVETLDPSSGNKPAPDFTAEFQRVRDASGAVTGFAVEKCGIDLQSASVGPAAPGG